MNVISKKRAGQPYKTLSLKRKDITDS